MKKSATALSGSSKQIRISEIISNKSDFETEDGHSDLIDESYCVTVDESDPEYEGEIIGSYDPVGILKATYRTLCPFHYSFFLPGKQ